jgi:hypothetical protein
MFPLTPVTMMSSIKQLEPELNWNWTPVPSVNVTVLVEIWVHTLSGMVLELPDAYILVLWAGVVPFVIIQLVVEPLVEGHNIHAEADTEAPDAAENPL